MMKTDVILELEEVTLGMTVAQDVFDAQGQALLCEGTVLTETVVGALRAASISSVAVRPSQRQDLDRLPVERRVRGHFHLVDLSHPFCRELFALCLKRAEGRAAAGMESEPVLTLRPSADKNPARPSLPMGKNVRERIEVLFCDEPSLTTPPVVFLRLMEVLNDRSSSSDDLACIIGSDPGLSARLLRLVNSGLYSFPAQVDTVSRAVTIVGTEQLSDLALGTSVIARFTGVARDMVDMDLFWRHSLACGLIARSLASQTGVRNVERFFVAGLLHDVGRLVLLLKKSRTMASALRYSREYSTGLDTEEQAILGYSHAKVGQVMLQRWNLPEGLTSTVGHHHSSVLESPFPHETAIIHIANVIANAAQMGSAGEAIVPPVAPGAWESLRLLPGAVGCALEAAEVQINTMLAVMFDHEGSQT